MIKAKGVKILTGALFLIFATACAVIAMCQPSTEKATAERISSGAAQLMSDEIPVPDCAEKYGDAVNVYDVSEKIGDRQVFAYIYNSPDDEGYHSLVISGKGRMKSYGGNIDAAPWRAAYASSIKEVIVEDGVTSIDVSALCYNVENITNIVIGKGIISLGTYSFATCKKLESLTLPFVGETLNGTENTHFGYIFGSYSVAYHKEDVPASLKTVVITGGKSIGAGAFKNCSGLTSVSLPVTVESIGSSAFYGCSSLESITLPFVGATKNGTENTHFGYIFGASNSSSNKNYVPSSLKEVRVLGGNVDYSAFFGCAYIERAFLPDNIESIGTNAFSGCTSLEYTEYDGMKFLGNEANPYLVLAENISKDRTSVSIPEATRIMLNKAFADCKNLTAVSTPSSLVYIGEYAFGWCSNLVDLRLNDGLKTIWIEAFYCCEALKSVVIPDGVKSVAGGAFSGCSSLRTLVVPRGARVTEGAFPLTDGLTLYCKENSLPESWIYMEEEREYWNEYFNSITVVWGYDEDLYFGTSLTLGTDLSVNVYLDVPSTEYVTARFITGDRIAETVGVYDEVSGLLKFVFRGVTPIYLGERINITVEKNGEALISICGYSVKKYCHDLLSVSGEDLGLSEARYAAARTVVCDLLEYGAAAQKYMNYKTDSLVNEGVTESSALTSEWYDSLETDMSIVSHTSVDGMRFTAASLHFSYTNRIRFKFVAPDLADVRIVMSVNGVNTTYTEGDFICEDGVYSIYTDDISATGYDDVYSVTLFLGDVAVQTLTYSVRSYICSMIWVDSDNSFLRLLIMRTYMYGCSAKAYRAAV